MKARRDQPDDQATPATEPSEARDPGPDPARAGPPAPVDAAPSTRRGGRHLAVILAVLLLAAGAAGGGWYWWQRQQAAALPWASSATAASRPSRWTWRPRSPAGSRRCSSTRGTWCTPVRCSRAWTRARWRRRCTGRGAGAAGAPGAGSAPGRGGAAARPAHPRPGGAGPHPQPGPGRLCHAAVPRPAREHAGQRRWRAERRHRAIRPSRRSGRRGGGARPHPVADSTLVAPLDGRVQCRLAQPSEVLGAGGRC